MIFLKKANQHAWLWWVSLITLSIGFSIFFLLEPAADNDPDVQGCRAMTLVVSIIVSGLCIIIGTRGRWFGKDL